MSTLNELAQNCSNANYRKIYSKIKEAASSTMKFSADGVPLTSASHTAEEINDIKNLMHEEVKVSYVRDGAPFVSLSELSRSVEVNTKKIVESITKDGFYNPMSGIGTSNDPGIHNTSSLPLLMGPGETTSLYANGGIAAVIIDKKAKGAVLNGYSILSNRFTAQELQDLREHCESKGLASGIANGMVNGYNYGGAVVYPMFVRDTPVSTAMTLNQLIKTGTAAKGTLSHLVAADRWNLVVIPNYDLSAEDYIRPKSFYVPISGLQVSTERAAVLRPKPQPYWAAIRQLGWGMPDSNGYMSSLLAYKIVIASIPIMAQQMSLVVHRLPLEGIIAMNGPAAAKAWQKENEQELREWSMLNPKAINAYGELDVLNRTYTGFGELVDSLRKDVSSNSGLPESVIFYTQPSGIFNKTEEDVLLKQSETIKMGQSAVTPELNKLLVYYAIDLWGLPEGAASLEKYKTLQFSFDTPVVSSPSEKADIGLKFSQMIAQLCGAGMPWETALAYAKQYLGEVEVPKDIEAKLTSVPEIKAPEQVDPNISGKDDPNTPTAPGEPNA